MKPEAKQAEYKELVLVGGGHTHVLALKQFAMRPLAGARVTLVSRDLQAPYSGMLPGYVAGHYALDDILIDLLPLCRSAGVRFFHDEVTGLDTDDKRLICRERPPLRYDILSINIGCLPDLSALSSVADNVTPVKPIDGFVAGWRRIRERISARGSNPRIGIVGAGAAGVELALALQHRLAQERAQFHLFSDTDEILPGHNRRARAKFLRLLGQRNILVHTGHQVTETGNGGLRCANGAGFELDEVLWATSAGAQQWPAQAGLKVDARGFVSVGATLESVSHADIFAVGDSAQIVGHLRPKAGVFAVRQGLPLASNIRRKLAGRPLKPFFPQKAFLSLVSCGERYAVASRSWWALEGRWVWRWKDGIDRRFMRQFKQLPAMKARDPRHKPDASTAMRCHGCGSKTGSALLEKTLAKLRPVARDDVVIGLNEPDDAAVVSAPAGQLVAHSVDYFRSFADDPYVFGQIAANHALADLYAMGATPQTALAIVTVPYDNAERTEGLLSDMLQGALKALNEANTALVGGHTGEGEELALGFAVNGLIDAGRMLPKRGAGVGERLVLTKALGVGALLAADMRHQVQGPWLAGAMESMLQSNRAAGQCLLAHGATACTDVTGFGLVGHLLEMLDRGELAAEIELDAIPFLAGAETVAARGISSSLYPQNLLAGEKLCNIEDVAGDARYPLLFDPQTSGGLLAAVPQDRVPGCVEALRGLGYDRAGIIGALAPRQAQPVALKLTRRRTV